MFTRAVPAVVLGLTIACSSYAQPAQTMFPGTSDTKAVYDNVNTGPMRTTLTSENKFPETGQLELGGFFQHAEQTEDLEQDSFGVYARYGLWENVTFGAAVPFVDSEFNDESNSGLGDVVLSLDLLAYQDIFRYPFVIPHVDVGLPTGDEDEGLGTGETVINFGLSVGTKVYDQLTYVIDLSYAFNGALDVPGDNVAYLSGSLVWDISDRFAAFVEGRAYDKNTLDDYPYLVEAGLSYMLTRDVMITGYGGTLSIDENGESESYDIAGARVAVQF